MRCLNAQFPIAGLVQGTGGSFYGTASEGGGNSNAGAIFQVTASGSLNTLYAFTGAGDGGDPHGTLVQGANGDFYGTTESGGGNSDGTVFRVTPAGSLTTLYSFAGTPDGANPFAGLVTGTDGDFYGTTETSGAGGAGTLFRITPGGSLTTLHAFTGGDDGGHPQDTLVSATDGSFYGTAEAGGAGGTGTVFQLTSSGSLATLHAFTALAGGTNADGASPFAGVVLANDGNLYGTTEAGGAGGTGTVYQLTTSGSLTTLYSFSTLVGGTNADGANPYGGLIQASDGNLYGTTETGGTHGMGTVYQITTSGSFATLHSFTGGTDGANPYDALVEGTNGIFTARPRAAALPTPGRCSKSPPAARSPRSRHSAAPPSN